MTEEIFREDAYARTCEATVTGISDDGIQLDRTVFYAAGGGQLGDTGVLRAADGRAVAITDTIRDKASGAHLHVPAPDAPALAVGDAEVAPPQGSGTAAVPDPFSHVAVTEMGRFRGFPVTAGLGVKQPGPAQHFKDRSHASHHDTHRSPRHLHRHDSHGFLRHPRLQFL